MRISNPITRRKARIEIIPLIDVIFFLLATFMMISLSMIKNQGINVNLPTARTSASQDRSKSVTITVTETGDRTHFRNFEYFANFNHTNDAFFLLR